MAGDTLITVVGNLTADPELRFTPAGHAVCNFTVASTPRTFDKNKNEWVDGEALFLRCTIWRQAAENVAESLGRGARVIVYGRLSQRSYEKDGEKRTAYELDVEEVGPSLKWATARVEKANRDQAAPQQQQQQQQRQSAPAQQSDDPWSRTRSDASPAPAGGGGWSDPPPF